MHSRSEKRYICGFTHLACNGTLSVIRLFAFVLPDFLPVSVLCCFSLSLSTFPPPLLSPRSLSLSHAPSPPPLPQQYSLVYKGFSLHPEEILFWQLPPLYKGDKVTFGVTPQCSVLLRATVTQSRRHYRVCSEAAGRAMGVPPVASLLSFTSKCGTSTNTTRAVSRGDVNAFALWNFTFLSRRWAPARAVERKGSASTAALVTPHLRDPWFKTRGLRPSLTQKMCLNIIIYIALVAKPTSLF